MADLRAWAAKYGLTPAEMWELAFYGKFPGIATVDDLICLMAITPHIRPEKILN